MKVRVNENCIGCGACASICPDVFEVDEVSKVICDDFSKVNEDELNDAIESCPTLAIEKVEE